MIFLQTIVSWITWIYQIIGNAVKFNNNGSTTRKPPVENTNSSNGIRYETTYASKGKFIIKQYIPHNVYKPKYCNCDLTMFCDTCQSKLLHPMTCEGTNKDIKRMKQMLNKNPDLINGLPNNNESIPLVVALIYDHKRCTQFLVKNGATLPTPLTFILTKALADTTSNSKIKYSYVKTIKDVLINSKKEQIKSVLGTNLIFPVLMEYHRIGCNLIESFLKYGACPNLYIETTGAKLSLLSIIIAYYNPPNSPNKYELLKMLLDYGTIVNKNIKICDDILFAVILNNRKALKILLWYYVPTRKMYDQEYSAVMKFIFTTEKISSGDKLKYLEILRSFGYNVSLSHDIFIRCGELNAELKAMRELCCKPISLKCLSRLAVLKSMGPKFRDNYKKLAIPKELLKFLEFEDLEKVIQ